MSVLVALARAQAAASGFAQPVATVRHVRLHPRPLVFVPLALAGEAHAPLAALVGEDRDAPRLLLVAQPRDRSRRLAFAAELADIVLPYLDARRGDVEIIPVDRGREIRQRYLDAPQLVVPNPAGMEFVRLLGRWLRFRRVDGEHPAPPQVPRLGCWLTFLADRAELPGSSLLVALTEALGTHWATGQSVVEDAHLASLVAWIDPPEGRTGAGAAAATEDPSVCPPAGPATDPDFDRVVLAPLIADHSRAATDAARTAVERRLADVLRAQLEPTWQSVWQALDLLRALPEAASTSERWAHDRDAFSDYAAHLDAGGAPQPRHDSAVAAAARLHRLERAAAAFERQRAYDDPMVMAEHRLTGEAFAGLVTLAAPDRVDDSGRRPVLRPRIMVRSDDPIPPAVGATLGSPARRAQKARVVSVDGADILLELSGGMGRGLSAPEGSVPAVGERVVYTTVVDAFAPSATFPPVDQTPWTHGGPPAPPSEPAAGALAVGGQG
ncbi:hypothetical protein [Pilimelia columellifera]|uniref:Uncharacterized protein n=1 Tax=Pilimelia columellifera subsp. columellifera TaxID=706583 RepID=A0ABN3NAI2_9ACTN